MRKIKKLDTEYFQARVIEATSKEGLTFVDLSSMDERHHAHFNVFKEILNGTFKKRSDS